MISSEITVCSYLDDEKYIDVGHQKTMNFLFSLFSKLMPDLSLSQSLFPLTECECKNKDDCDTSMMDPCWVNMLLGSSVVSVEGICYCYRMFHQ